MALRKRYSDLKPLLPGGMEQPSLYHGMEQWNRVEQPCLSFASQSNNAAEHIHKESEEEKPNSEDKQTTSLWTFNRVRLREAIKYQLCIFFNIVQTAIDPPSPLVLNMHVAIFC